MASSSFAALLQPIKELASNWNVDIAAQLSDYLQEIEQIKIAFDNGKTSVDFAQAALIIQNSAFVYSKKVEYLHKLVFETLDFLSKKRIQPTKSAGSEDEESTESSDAGKADVPAKRKRMRGKKEDDSKTLYLSLDDIEICSQSLLKPGQAMMSLNEIRDFRVPGELRPLEEFEKGNFPMLNDRGEVIGNCRDFKINSAFMFGDFMLINPADVEYLDESFEPPLPRGDGDGNVGCIENHPNNQSFDYGKEALLNLSNGGELQPLPDDEDNGNAGDMSICQEGEDQRPASEQRRPTLRECCVDKVEKIAAKVMLFEKLADVYEEDSHRCFRKRRMPYLPPAQASRCKRKHSTPDTSSLSQFLHRTYFSTSQRLIKNPIKTLRKVELEALYWPECQRRNKILLTLQFGKRFTGTGARAQQNGEIQPLGNDADFGDIIIEDCVEHDDVDDVDEDIAAIHPDFPPYIDEERQQFPDTQENSYESLMKRHVDEFMSSAKDYLQTSDISKKISDWEERIVPRLEEEELRVPFDIRKSGQHVITKFHSVGMPEAITDDEPMLLAFSDIVSGQETYEIARSFLATLQLANDGNVEICVDQEGRHGDKIDELNLKLLSRKRRHEHLEAMLRPS